MTEPKKHFRPRARLMQLLGEQLIRDHRMALFELVKNSYDADATEVKILFRNITRDNAEIIVGDNGFGMDINTVHGVWLEPASDHKERSREKNERTPLGRLPVGEKGVGRFAVHRLGDKIEMVTRAKGSKEVHVSIDWMNFLQHKYLDEAPVEILERIPTRFTGEATGTEIKITYLKHKWSRGDIRRLYRSVMAMTTPRLDKEEVKDRRSHKGLDNEKQKHSDSFDVDFNLVPSNDWLNDLFSPDTARDQAMFYYEFTIDDNGFRSEYKFQPLCALKADYKKIIFERKEERDSGYAFEYYKKRPPTEDESWKTRKDRNKRPSLEELGVGPIRGIIRAFDLDKDIVARYVPDASGLKGFLKEQGGIRVYRDGMRVYDYGEPGNDWLGLDHRRFQQPTKRLSNNLVMGHVHLKLETSTALREKTNREGFIENEAYRELQYAVLCALSQFEVERNKDKDRIRECFKISESTSPCNKKPTTESAIEELKQKILEENLEGKLGKYVEQISITYHKTRDTLMSAAGSGLGLVTVFHEIERGVRGLHRSIEQKVSLELLEKQSKHLMETLQGAAFMVTKSQQEALDASRLVKYALLSQSSRFEYHNIDFQNGFESLPDQDFKIKGIRRMYTAALVNLIDNAIHWIKMRRNDKKEKGFIWIGPSHDLDGPAIIVADSGTGFEDPPEDVVQPFFTRRMEGMGIGLYYSDMVMKNHGGRLAFPGASDVEIPKVCDGAVVAMVFRSKEG
jgi:anti-sigma regulatory factor (Ser/Thr protein kinase)